jgi:signal transduction histidine kinase
MMGAAAHRDAEDSAPNAPGELRLAHRAGRRAADLAIENERLRRTSKLQSELVAAVAHELRTPLSSVVGFSDLLLRRELDASTRERYLRIINAETRRLGELIDDLFDVQLVAAGASTLVTDVFDLADVVGQQVELFGAARDRHTILLSLPAEPLLVDADPARITQVVANLLSNAIKYSPEGGIVEVVAAVRHGVIRVSVRDSGIGIPADQHHLVFSRFYRADAAGTGPTKGIGLGLALSREIVHAHGGSLGFDSAEREGSTFWFELDEAGADASDADTQRESS